MSEHGGSPQMVRQKARMGPRILAYLVEGVIASIPIMILGCIAGVVTGPQLAAAEEPSGLVWGLIALAGLVGFGWSILYTLVRDCLGQGQSLGKRTTKLMVVRLEDGRPCTMGNSIVRNVIGAFLGIIDIIVALLNENGQRVGDMLVKTQVVAAPDRRG